MSKQLTEFDLQRIQTLHNEQEAARVALAEEIGYEKLKTLKKKARATIPWQEIQNSLERGNGFVPTPWKVEWNSKFAAPKDMKASARNTLLRAIHKNTFDFIWKEQVDETAQVQIDTVHESDSKEEQEVEQ
ncbi:hypothetical protein BJV82DRAFT_674677 [Fennellomyces sp. T-0311]|nr:hypothetical protein BJV82DRAFT_674677 [Fennellomyces sp. T-0311]